MSPSLLNTHPCGDAEAGEDGTTAASASSNIMVGTDMISPACKIHTSWRDELVGETEEGTRIRRMGEINIYCIQIGGRPTVKNPLPYV